MVNLVVRYFILKVEMLEKVCDICGRTEESKGAKSIRCRKDSLFNKCAGKTDYLPTKN
jgi:tRNA(Ile2) C34 agmatinyltransferase TiaS